MPQTFLTHFKSPLNILEYFGLWQAKGKRFYCGFVAISIFVVINFIFPLVYVLKSESFEEDAVNIFFIYLGPTIKVINFLWRKKSIENLYNALLDLLQITKLDKNEAKIKFMSHAKFMTRVFVFCFGSTLFSALTDISVPLMENRLPYTTWIPYNYNSNAYVFWITSVSQVVLAMVGSSFAICIEIIPIFFIAMADIFLIDLLEKMEMLSEKEGKRDNEIVECVKRHLKIKEYVLKIETQFSLTFFAQVLSSAGFICLTVFQLSKVDLLFSVKIFQC